MFIKLIASKIIKCALFFYLLPKITNKQINFNNLVNLTKCYKTNALSINALGKMVFNLV